MQKSRKIRLKNQFREKKKGGVALKSQQEENLTKNKLTLKQHNELNELPLKGFDAIEADVFLTICEKVQDCGTEEIKIPISGIKELIAFGRKDLKEGEFLAKIKSVGDKINLITESEEPGKEWIRRVLFPTYGYLIEEDALLVQVHSYYAPWLNALTQNYARLYVEQVVQLKTFYSKCIYKRLSQYRKTGFWKVGKEELIEYLCMPEGTTVSNLMRTIDKAIEENRKFFKRLKCKCVYDNRNGKGRPKLVELHFTFTPEKSEKSRAELTQEKIADMTGATWTGKYCPRCGEKIFSKDFTTDNGTIYAKLGHTDYKTGSCDYRPYYDELLTNEEADAKFGGEPREAAKGPSEEAKAKQQQKEAEIFAAEDREREAEEEARLKQQERELTEKLGRKPTEEELTEEAKRRAFEAMKVYKY